MNDDSTSRQRRLAWAIFTAVIAIFAWLVIRNAWLCDDAFITFRVVDNFHNDYGLRWNVVDRVQVFTHPLWCLTLVCVGGFFENLPIASLWFSIVVSIAAFALIVPRPGRSNSDLILLALMIPASKAGGAVRDFRPRRAALVSAARAAGPRLWWSGARMESPGPFGSPPGCR